MTRAIYKRAVVTLIMAVSLLFATGVFLMAHDIALVTAHYRSQIPSEDKRFLSVSRFRCAPDGIVLFVKSTSPVVKVQGPQASFRHPFYDVSHQLLVRQPGGEYLILVPWKFAPRQEWYLELYSADGHWTSMSPYFSNAPDLSSADWKRLWALPRGTKVELPRQFRSGRP